MKASRIDGAYSCKNITFKEELIRKSIDSMNIDEPEKAKRAVGLMKLPVRQEEEILDIINAIATHKYDHLLNPVLSFSRVFTRDIPDVVLQYISINGNKNLVKINFKSYDCFILGCLCFKNDVTMGLVGDFSIETIFGEPLKLWDHYDLPGDLEEFLIRSKDGSIKKVLSDWSGLPIEQVEANLHWFLKDPLDNKNPLACALKMRFPTVYHNYKKLYQLWQVNQKFQVNSYTGLFAQPDFHTVVKEMIYEMTFVLAKEKKQNISIGIIEDGLVVPMNQYLGVGAILRGAFDQLLYMKPTEITSRFSSHNLHSQQVSYEGSISHIF